MKRVHLQKTAFFLMTGALLAYLPACNLGNPVGMGPVGGIYTSNTIGVAGNKTNELWKKQKRKACSQRIAVSYLQFAWGEGTVQDILKRSDPLTIYAIDKETFNILGVYSRLCTILYVGNPGEDVVTAPGEDRLAVRQ